MITYTMNTSGELTTYQTEFTKQELELIVKLLREQQASEQLLIAKLNNIIRRETKLLADEDRRKSVDDSSDTVPVRERAGS